LDAKLEKLLMMALRSDTNDHEADAAFRAARRMSKGQDVHKMLSSGVTTVVEKVVYRTAALGNHKRQFEISVPASFQFSMLERVFLDGAQHSVDVHMISCGSQNNSINSGLKLVVEVVGDKSNVDDYSIMLDGYIDQVKDKVRGHSPPRSNKDSEKHSAKKSFWSKLFGK
jgi:hypothetical protein